MKFLLLLVVIGVAVWMFGSRLRGPRPERRAPPAARQPPATMIACAHCGVHLPQAEAVVDAGGRSFCSEAHRLAGPR